MTLSICLLLDRAAETRVRRLWDRLEEAGVRTLATHTHGRHVPHLTFASLLSADLGPVVEALGRLPAHDPVRLRFDGLGMFPRSRCWLAPAVPGELIPRQAAAVETARACGAVVHRNYEPGTWLPHLTLAPRLHLEDLPTVARVSFEVLPLTAELCSAAVIDTATGDIHPLARLL
ncbi:MAG: 2'-5' RNA ligase family protein [Nocardioides sp.]